MKTNKLIASILVATSILGAMPVFALSTEELTSRTQKEQAVIQRIEQGKVKGYETNTYGYVVSVTDKFGNIIKGDTKWDGSGFTIGARYSKPHSLSTTVTRKGYKPSTVKLDCKNQGVVQKTLVLEPENFNQVIVGTVKLPQDVVKGNWYIQVMDKTKKSYEQELAYIKVQDNGTFKMHNLGNGEYQLTLVNGEMKSFQLTNSTSLTQTFDVDLAYPAETVKIDGNLNKQFDYTAVKPLDVMNTDNLFEGVDYSNPELFVHTDSEYLEVPEDMKAKIDAKVDNNKNINTVNQIFDFMFSEIKRVAATGKFVEKQYPNFKQIVVKGMSACEEYATAFQAIANYKGIPTVAVWGTDTTHAKQLQANYSEGNIKGHAFVEAYVDGKWILLDTTATEIDLTYDKDDKNIVTSVAPHYAMWKQPTFEGMWNSRHFMNTSDLTNYYLDLTLVTSTDNEPLQR